jgi:hypothetical protein
MLGAVASLASTARGAVLVPDLLQITQTSVSRYNPDTPGTAYVRSTGTGGFGDMTRANDGRILAYRTNTQSQTPALFQIDPATGNATLVVQSASAPGRVVALAPMANGDLLGCDNNLGFVEINPNTMAYTQLPLVASNAPQTIFSGGMATSATGQIYAWCSGFAPGAGVYSKLFLIDTTAKTATAIGGYDGLAASGSLNAMAFAPDGRLFGFTDLNGGNNGSPLLANAMYEVNPKTGALTLILQRQELTDVRGVVFLPEPATAGVLALAMTAMFSRRRRKC